MKPHFKKINLGVLFFSPCTCSHWGFQGVRVADHLIKDANYLIKFGTLGSVFLPAVQH